MNIGDNVKITIRKKIYYGKIEKYLTDNTIFVRYNLNGQSVVGYFSKDQLEVVQEIKEESHELRKYKNVRIQCSNCNKIYVEEDEKYIDSYCPNCMKRKWIFLEDLGVW